MDIPVPREIDDYRQLRDVGRTLRRRLTVFRIAVLVSFISVVPVWVLVIRSGWPKGIGLLPIAAIFASAIGLAVSSERKHKCPKCKRKMRKLEEPWTADAWRAARRPELGMIFGRDGHVYSTATTRRESSPRDAHVVYQHKQKWAVCDTCRLCYLANDSIVSKVFSAHSKDKWDAYMSDL